MTADIMLRNLMVGSIITFVTLFIFGLVVGLNLYLPKKATNTSKAELEQKLCLLKQYEYCTKEELLKTIK